MAGGFRGPLGSVAGGLVGGLAESLFGPKKPTVPPYTPVSPTTALTKTTSANLAGLPDIEKLGGKINEWTQAQLDKFLTKTVGAGTIGNIKQNFSDLIAGKLPQDVAESSQLKSAARSLGMGVAGSGMGRAMELKDLGLTSLAAQQQGFSQLLQWANEAKAPQFDPTKMFLSPSQVYPQMEQQNQFDWRRNLLASEIGAAATSGDIGGAMMFTGGLGALSRLASSGGLYNPGGGYGSTGLFGDGGSTEDWAGSLGLESYATNLLEGIDIPG